MRVKSLKENIETLFKRKKDAQVWLFDESDNALDDDENKRTSMI
jgi:hypothetical protein